MLTYAQVQPTGHTARLTRNGKSVTLHVTGQDTGDLKVNPAKGPNDYDAPNPGASLVTFEVNVPAGESRAWTVSIAPEGKTAAHDTEPLERW